jgi:hypothetical protein
MRGRALARLIEDLGDGDPVAWIAVGVFVVIALAVCLFWWKTARDLRREDEQKKSRNYTKKKQ